MGRRPDATPALASCKNETPAGETAGASRSGPAVNGSALPPSPADDGRRMEGVILRLESQHLGCKLSAPSPGEPPTKLKSM